MNQIRHVGLTVYNIENAINFYCTAFNFSLETRCERDASYTKQVTHVENTPIKIALIRNNEYLIELLEYTNTKSNHTSVAPLFNPGSAHICFQVESIEKMRTIVLELGATVHKEIITVPSGVGAGNKVIYGFDPDGIPFEMVEVRC